MLNNSDPGQAAYEPFLGSGTTPIAAETTVEETTVELSRDRFGAAPRGCRVRRWQAFTDNHAIPQSMGRSTNCRPPENAAVLGRWRSGWC